LNFSLTAEFQFPSAFLNRSELRDASRHFMRHAKEGGHELLIDIGNAFILDKVSFAVRAVEDTPLFRGDLQGMSQCLEHEIAIVRPITVPAQRGERERVRGVVGEVEAAVQR
jgi:hypothetical protein